MIFTKYRKEIAKVVAIIFVICMRLSIGYDETISAATLQKPVTKSVTKPVAKTTTKTTSAAVKSSSNNKTASSRGYYIAPQKVSSRGNYSYCISMQATAYSAGKGAYTASGMKAAVGRIAVDPRVIPLGTKLYIESVDGSKDYGYAVAADTGSAIKNNKIDLFFDTNREACNWGVRSVKVYIYK